LDVTVTSNDASSALLPTPAAAVSIGHLYCIFTVGKKSNIVSWNILSLKILKIVHITIKLYICQRHVNMS